MIELLLLLVAFGLMLIAALVVIINYVLMGYYHTMAFWLAFLAAVGLCMKLAYNDLKKFKL